MERIGVRELRQNASRYLARVKQGESIEVTERGVPIAVLSPVPAKESSLYDRLVAEGKLIPGKQDWAGFFERHPLTGPVTTAGSEALQEQREERL